MSTRALSAPIGETSPLVSSISFPKMAGIAGLFSVAAGMAATVVAGEPPGLGASAGELASFFARSGGTHKVGVIVPALLAIPLTLFLVGVYRTLAAADRRAGSCWAIVYLYGAIMMSATAGLGEGLFAVAALRQGVGLSPEMLRMLNDGSQIANATVGVWMAVATGSVAVATFQHRIRPIWYGWLCALAAVLGALSVIDTVSTTTGGVFAQLAFLAGFLGWVIASSILMLRERNVPVSGAA
jgi:hypothetical protein